MKLIDVIDELVEEKGLERDVLSAIIQEGMLAGYQKKYPELVLTTEYDKKSGELAILTEKEVVANVEDEDTQISVRKARFINETASIGDKVWLPFEGKIGRIEILKAKQVIAARIRKVEADAVYNEFKSKEGTIVHGVIHKCDRNGVTVSLQTQFAFMPKSLSIPGEKLTVGYSIRALLKEVLAEPRGESQLILDRSSGEFLTCLFELEIPEVFEHLVELKNVVRAPGYKAKVVVASNDANIDPVGTCVGVGGVRIKPILKELSGEKIDVIAYTDSLETLVKNSLKPAEVNRVELVDDKNANVWLDNEQRSLAIGKGGQNITLASRLTGLNIHLVQTDEQKAEQAAAAEHDED